MDEIDLTLNTYELELIINSLYANEGEFYTHNDEDKAEAHALIQLAEKLSKILNG